MTHVLLIDDEQVWRDCLNYALVKEGYQVTTAANGETVLASLKKK